MDTHEQMIGGGAPARASDRAFWAAFAATLAVIGAVAWLASAALSAWLFVVSGALLVVAFLTPELLSPLNALRARLLDSVTTPPPPTITDFVAYSLLFGGIRYLFPRDCCSSGLRERLGSGCARRLRKVVCRPYSFMAWVCSGLLIPRFA